MIALGFALLLAAGPAPKAEPHAIILGGGATLADATAALDAWKANAPPFLKPASGYPKAVASDSIPGLNKGFHIVVLGYCPKTSDVPDIARAMHPGTYSKAVTKAPAGTCPAFTEEIAFGRNLTSVATHPFAKGSKLTWEALTNEGPCKSLFLRVKLGEKVLDEKKLEATCREGTREHDLGSSTIYELEGTVEAGGRTLLLVNEKSYAEDTGSIVDKLYGWACGSTHELASLGIRMLLGSRADGDGIVAVQTTAGIPSLSVTLEGETETLDWDPKKCAYARK